MMHRVFLEDVEAATVSAAAYLRSRQEADGLWRDFHTLAGPSSDWVTAFVCYATRLRDELAPERFEAVRSLLGRQRPNGGWSYNRRVPTDCDSASWVLLALSTTAIARPSVVARATGYLKLHQSPTTGGFSTYVPQDGIGRYIGAMETETIEGWTSSHTCVTAIALLALVAQGELNSICTRRTVDYLVRQRDPGGLWKSYWWPGWGYGTYQTVRVLAALGHLDEYAITRTLETARREQREDGAWSELEGGEGEVLATAFRVLLLLLRPFGENLMAASRGIEWLAQEQLMNGGWEPSPILRIPPPMVKDPDQVRSWNVNGEGTAVLIEDRNGIFTTAAAIWALSVYLLTSPS